MQFSHRYIAGRQLPDKAVSVLDTACARLALGQNRFRRSGSRERRLDDLHGAGAGARSAKQRSAADHAERLDAIAKEKAETEAALVELQARFEKERDLVSQDSRNSGQDRSARPRAPAASAAAAGARSGRSSARAGTADVDGLRSRTRRN